MEGGFVASVVTFARQHWLMTGLLVFLLVFVTIHVVWYIHPSEAIETIADLDRMLQDGQPTVVEFYTNL